MTVTAIILNIVIIVLEVVGATRSEMKLSLRTFVFYTQISNALTFISSILLLIFGSHPWTILLRYTSCCFMLMTFVIVVFVLVPTYGEVKRLLFSGTGLYFHLLCPLTSITTYLLFEDHIGLWPIPAILTFIYGITMLYLNYVGKVDGPYPFFRVHQQSKTATLLWMTALTCLIAFLSFILSRA